LPPPSASPNSRRIPARAGAASSSRASGRGSAGEAENPGRGRGPRPGPGLSPPGPDRWRAPAAPPEQMEGPSPRAGAAARPGAAGRPGPERPRRRGPAGGSARLRACQGSRSPPRGSAGGGAATAAWARGTGSRNRRAAREDGRGRKDSRTGRAPGVRWRIRRSSSAGRGSSRRRPPIRPDRPSSGRIRDRSRGRCPGRQRRPAPTRHRGVGAGRGALRGLSGWARSSPDTSLTRLPPDAPGRRRVLGGLSTVPVPRVESVIRRGRSPLRAAAGFGWSRDGRGAEIASRRGIPRPAGSPGPIRVGAFRTASGGLRPIPGSDAPAVANDPCG